MKKADTLRLNSYADDLISALANSLFSNIDDAEEHAATAFLSSVGALAACGYQIMAPINTPPIDLLTRAVAGNRDRRRALRKEATTSEAAAQRGIVEPDHE